jgi:hypothetical protein
MRFWQRHWFDVGGALAPLLSSWLYLHRAGLSADQLLMGTSFVTLLLHQVEEYRWPGYFPGMLNAAVYGSPTPDRFPLNPQTALLINVLLGWGCYALAALFARQLPWLGIATILISLGNVVAHACLFNLKGKTWYNPGMATALLLFLPLTIGYGHLLLTHHLAAPRDWQLGVPLGIALNYFGIIKPIDWLADPNTSFRFATRQLRPVDRADVVGSEGAKP